MAKRKSRETESEQAEISLESAMAELGQIVSGLESGQESLDESLARFERGMTLLRICHRKLDAAAQRVEILTGISGEEISTAEFDSTSTLQRNAGTRKSTIADSAADEDDSGLLF